MPTRLILLVATLVLLSPGTGFAADPAGVWPLRPHVVVAGFDPPTSQWGAGHRGVDLRGRAGEPVRAALAGRISYVGRIAGRGVVVVDHGDTRTTYEPVRDAPPVGTSVAAGDRVGHLETTGSHCWPEVCLHWGWIRSETYLDPLLLVGAGPVRLVPLTGLSSAAGMPAPGPPAARMPPSVPPGILGGAVSGARSGARVGLLVGLAEPVGRHVRVELGRGQ
jgi:murein DD-endopeptidase MepM/ murein hydrolase activator NlpD